MNGLLSPQDGETTTVFGTLSPLLSLDFEPVGRWFEAHHRRAHSLHSHSHHSLGGGSSSSESEEEEEEEDQFDEEDESLLLRLDPREWKKQDHYAVLGLSKLRHRASEDQIKRAYKQKVLTHHPDKRKARGKKVKEGEDDYFTCITRAYEILGNKQQRRSFDSVDPEFDDSVPSISQNSKDNFYEVFRPVFERNARWSTKRRVPKLGDENTPFDEVDHFYFFWYEFDSWREFSYLDEEEKEKGENREERRWIEKQNKAARQKLKKEEVVRLRQLVDNAYACDPRIQKFREEEKERRNAAKRAKQEAARQRVEEEERKRQEILEEERKKKEKLEEEARVQAAKAKKEKEVYRRQLKKERKTLRTFMKDNDYFASSEEERVSMLQEVDRVTELLSLTSLQSLNESLGKCSKDTGKEIFMKGVKQVNEQLEEEKRQQLELTTQKSGSGGASGGAKKYWSEAETQVLIKGVNLFPAGTQDRWEVIANFIGQHVSETNKTAKDVLAKAKELQKNDMKLREEVKQNAFSKFEQSHKAAKSGDMEKPSERLESVGEQQVRETGTNQAPWTADEQKLLEQALKSYPVSDKERWDKIASAVPSRSKKDCMKRYKELCELVKAKKQAQTAVAAKNKKS
ncbi:Dnaj homolog subfamily c member 2-like [Plakobranchus ocellatus]|uniref:DnaJ homolog subfamily C member 2 n=1 Tax=Plakobranchus ocellatus TaxID=259542 RepID=A0AAV3ZG01_9GAST|nr:Dnaj homolog subfamily c member 2-like [Plakobranchus ocellatus]